MNSDKIGTFNPDLRLYLEAEDKYTGDIWRADFN